MHECSHLNANLFRSGCTLHGVAPRAVLPHDDWLFDACTRAAVAASRLGVVRAGACVSVSVGVGGKRIRHVVVCYTC
jgi:hypothetical protein